MTAAVTLKVDRVGKVHTAANALPGLRSHQLQLALHDMVIHHFHAGQQLWLHLPHTAARQPPAPPLPLPAPVWLLVEAWAHAAVTAGAARVQLAPSHPTLYAAPLVQPGDAVTVTSLTAPLLPAAAIILRRLTADGGVPTDSAAVDSSADPSTSGSSLQPAIDSFISAALLNRPCHVGMTLSVELFNTSQRLIIDAIEPVPFDAQPTSPPAVYIASATTGITVIKHSAASSAERPGRDTQAVDFCQLLSAPSLCCCCCCAWLVVARWRTLAV